MKKIAAVLLLAAMMMTSVLPALAETTGAGSLDDLGQSAGSTGDIPVYGMVDYDGDGVPDDGPVSVIAVDLEWSKMVFTYKIEEYDADKIAYSGSWKSGEVGTIKVSNRSNVAIKVEPEWTTAVTGLDLSLTAPFTLSKAIIRNDGTPGTARTRTIYVRIAANETTGIYESNTKLGTIKVKISET